MVKITQNTLTVHLEDVQKPPANIEDAHNVPSKI